jgi:hypothetical protein
MNPIIPKETGETIDSDLKFILSVLEHLDGSYKDDTELLQMWDCINSAQHYLHKHLEKHKDFN